MQAFDGVDIFFCKNSPRLLQHAAGGGVDIFFCKNSLQRLLQPAAGGGVDIFFCKKESLETPPASSRWWG